MCVVRVYIYVCCVCIYVCCECVYIYVCCECVHVCCVCVHVCVSIYRCVNVYVSSLHATDVVVSGFLPFRGCAYYCAPLCFMSSDPARICELLRLVRDVLQ